MTRTHLINTQSLLPRADLQKRSTSKYATKRHLCSARQVELVSSLPIYEIASSDRLEFPDGAVVTVVDSPADPAHAPWSWSSWSRLAPCLPLRMCTPNKRSPTPLKREPWRSSSEDLGPRLRWDNPQPSQRARPTPSGTARRCPRGSSTSIARPCVLRNTSALSTGSLRQARSREDWTLGAYSTPACS